MLPRGWGSTKKPTTSYKAASATSNSEAAQCRALWPRIRVGEGQGPILGAFQPTDPTSFQFCGRFSESPPPTLCRHPLSEVRRPRGGARSWPAGPFTCCVQKRVVDVPLGAAAGFLVTGAGDLPGGGPRGHAPAALRWLLGVSIEQSWTRTRSAGPRSASDSPGSYIPAHPQPRDSTEVGCKRRAESATLLRPAARPDLARPSPQPRRHSPHSLFPMPPVNFWAT